MTLSQSGNDRRFGHFVIQAKAGIHALPSGFCLRGNDVYVVAECMIKAVNPIPLGATFGVQGNNAPLS